MDTNTPEFAFVIQAIDQASKILNSLGSEGTKDVKKLNEELKDVNTNLKDVDNNSKKTNTTMSDFGKAFSAVVTIEALKKVVEVTKQAIDNFVELSETMPGAFTPQQMKAAEDYKDAIQDLKDTSDSLTIIMGGELLPALTDGMNWLTQTGIPAVEGYYDAIKSLSDWVVSLTDKFPGLKEAIELAFWPLTLAIKSATWLTDQLGESFDYMASQSPNKIQKVTDKLGDLTDVLIDIDREAAELAEYGIDIGVGNTVKKDKASKVTKPKDPGPVKPSSTQADADEAARQLRIYNQEQEKIDIANHALAVDEQKAEIARVQRESIFSYRQTELDDIRSYQEQVRAVEEEGLLSKEEIAQAEMNIYSRKIAAYGEYGEMMAQQVGAWSKALGMRDKEAAKIQSPLEFGLGIKDIAAAATAAAAQDYKGFSQYSLSAAAHFESAREFAKIAGASSKGSKKANAGGGGKNRSDTPEATTTGSGRQELLIKVEGMNPGDIITGEAVYKIIDEINDKLDAGSAKLNV